MFSGTGSLAYQLVLTQIYRSVFSFYFSFLCDCFYDIFGNLHFAHGDVTQHISQTT